MLREGLPPEGSSHGPPQSPLHISVVGNGESTTVRLAGELDLMSRTTLQDTLETVMVGTWSVRVDLSALEFIDASGLGALVMAHRQARALGVTLVLQDPSPPVAKVLDLTGLDSLVEPASRARGPIR